jgi:hypothetical protein
VYQKRTREEAIKGEQKNNMKKIPARKWVIERINSWHDRVPEIVYRI